MQYSYKIEGLECSTCAEKIENELKKNQNIKSASVSFATSTVTVETDISNPYAYIKKIISKVEPEATLHQEKESKEKTSPFLRLIVGFILGILGIIIKLPHKLNLVFVILGYIILIYKTFIISLKKLSHKNIDENFLLIVSATGAFFLSELLEGLMVIFLYELGKVLEEKAINKSRKSVSDLMNIKEEISNLKKGNKIVKVPTESIEVNDIIVVKVGEKVPLDGIVVKGEALLDTSSITGESRLMEVKEQDNILSGTINKKGLIEIKVTSTYRNSTVSKILNLVEAATERKAKTETFVSQYASYYTFGVLIISVLIGLFLPLFTSVTYKDSIYKALTVLVISCPCSIAISVPLSYFSGIGRASKEGILIKGSNYLDNIRNIREIVFDKTGTITTGDFYVSNINIYDEKYREDEILELYSKGESLSNHPIAKSILKRYQKEVITSDIKDYKEHSGKGISYTYNNQKIKIGSPTFCHSEEKDNHGKIYLSINNKVISSLEIKDEIKEGAHTTIDSLKKMNIKVRMFTGDSKEKAHEIASIVGIDDVSYEMLPQDKYNSLEKIIAKNKDKKYLVAFVGDGINDAPVITLSDIGISMGNIASDSAIEASDVVIMNDNLEKITQAISISKRTSQIIKENLIFAFIIKVSVLILTIFGISTMWEAVFADVGVTIICILNTLRLLKK